MGIGCLSHIMQQKEIRTLLGKYWSETQYIFFQGFAFYNIMVEVWKDIPSYEGYYQASDFGRIRSLDRTITFKNGVERFYKGKIIKGSVNKGGYRQTSLNKNGECMPLKFSQIVAITFLGHITDGGIHVVDHINGIKTDDNVDNLRVITQRENCSIGFRSDRENLKSKYVGVGFAQKSQRWVSKIHYKGVNIRIGCFENELDASMAYQKALSKIKDGSFNHEYYKPKYTSKYKGVYFSSKNGKWLAQIRINRKTKHVGIFKTEIEAHEAYCNYKISMGR